ncbi:hypothetical protein MNBD_BACTEROID01-2581 [hydrothermal vent metagenome]|uniref:Uncharacterized protein n=1 Tax=hydrothermal vent metagenome TaxID=652676 RepID=A0A3B0TY92_9ZZZZ
MEDDFLFDKIEQVFGDIPENFNILEEQIDIDVQLDYFKYSKELQHRGDNEYYLAKKDVLFGEEAGIEEKKEILTGLASLSEVDSFRTIEKYNTSPDEELKQWAILALQESRMLLKSSLLDEQQVFISTGLGGKGQKLRYFAVFINIRKEQKLSKIQQKVLFNELSDLLDKNDGEVEEISFWAGYTIAMVVLPLMAPLKEIFEDVIAESNQYGNFLSEDILITNVKKLSKEEIFKVIEEKKDLGLEYDE